MVISQHNHLLKPSFWKSVLLFLATFICIALTSTKTNITPTAPYKDTYSTTSTTRATSSHITSHRIPNRNYELTATPSQHNTPTSPPPPQLWALAVLAIATSPRKTSNQPSKTYTYTALRRRNTQTTPRATKPLAKTGLYYYGYRYYDPLTGRWPSRDPIGERSGLNRYVFVGNSALGLIDRLGLSVFIYGSIYGENPGDDIGNIKFRGFLPNTKTFADQVAAGLQELIGDCAEITVEWAGDLTGSQDGGRGKVYKLGYTDEDENCCSKCWKTIKGIIDSQKKYSVRYYERKNNAFWRRSGQRGMPDKYFGAEGSIYINPKIAVSLPEGSSNGNSASPPFIIPAEPTPFSVILWHELISHGFLGRGHPTSPENGANEIGRDANGNPIYEGLNSWTREGGDYVDPTIESENDARECLRGLGSDIGNRQPFYYGSSFSLGL